MNEERTGKCLRQVEHIRNELRKGKIIDHFTNIVGIYINILKYVQFYYVFNGHFGLILTYMYMYFDRYTPRFGRYCSVYICWSFEY